VREPVFTTASVQLLFIFIIMLGRFPSGFSRSAAALRYRLRSLSVSVLLASRTPEEIRRFVDEVVKKFSPSPETDAFQDRALKFKVWYRVVRCRGCNLLEQILNECVKEFDVEIASPLLTQVTSSAALVELLSKKSSSEGQESVKDEIPTNLHFD
jgi:hypothetical protein